MISEGVVGLMDVGGMSLQDKEVMLWCEDEEDDDDDDVDDDDDDDVVVVI